MSRFPPWDGVGAAGYWTVAEHRGRGLTGAALRVLADWAFDGVHRPELHRGQPSDVVLYGRLAGDPRP
jgi:RimJ/RimL family protein N-acetyltransferase